MEHSDEEMWADAVESEGGTSDEDTGVVEPEGAGTGDVEPERAGTGDVEPEGAGTGDDGNDNEEETVEATVSITIEDTSIGEPAG